MPPQRMPIASKCARKSAPSTMSLPQQQREAKRNRIEFDFGETFEVVVGKPASDAKRFSIHTSVITGRSGSLTEFLRADHDNPRRVVYLEDHDPELFQEYVHCVYFGPQALQQWVQASVIKTEANPDGNTRDEKQATADLVFGKLIGLHIIADSLIDFKTANMVTNEILRTSDVLGFIPTQGPVSLAYASTEKSSPLRRLLRDFWVYQSVSTQTDSEHLRTAGFPAECVQDIAIDMIRIASSDPNNTNFNQAFKDFCFDDACRYHHHNRLHPACVVGG